jgi:DNA-binding MarR family transcriptional regulator
MQKVPQALLERALRSYARSLAIIDPVRLRFWDSRGLTMPQLRIMFMLVEQDGATPGALAERFHVTPSTVTGLTDRLVRQRLISRREDQDDRRLVRIFLTPEGRQVVGELEAAGRAYLTKILEQLPPERLELLASLLEELWAAAENAQSRGVSS